MKNNIERIIGTIETWLFGEYFKQLAQPHDSMNYIKGYINTKEVMLNFPRLKDLNECKELLDCLGKEREFIDSKYGFMGNYTITNITFMNLDWCKPEDSPYWFELHLSYKFADLDWDKVKNTQD